MLLASLGLLLFLSTGPIAPAALWALALLLAILNAGLFIEAAAGELPLLSIVGSLVSWVILANWWTRAAGAVGVLAVAHGAGRACRSSRSPATRGAHPCRGAATVRRRAPDSRAGCSSG